MLTNFRLIDTSGLRKLESDLREPAIYAMCFDIDGQLTRVGWSSYPAQRIPGVINEQAAEVKELWIAEIPVDKFFNNAFDYNRENTVRRFGRSIQRHLNVYRTRNELFRVPMRLVDEAFGLTVTQSGALAA